jgi:cell division protein FtsW
MYLPEVWGDSIFPIIAEEIGFVFSSLVLILFLFLFYRILQTAKAAPDVFGMSLATGVVAWLSVQMFLNIGGQLNLIPMTGVPLPFISAGGSSILSSLIALGIVVNISKQTKNLK